METEKIGRHTVEFYGDIKELPVVRFQTYQKLLLIDAGIGGDIASVDKRLERTRRFLMAGQPKEAERELENLRQCIFLVQSSVLPKHRAFAALVTKIDGESFAEVTEAGLDRVTELLKDAPVGEVDAAMRAAKKKIEDDLLLYFPAVFNTGASREYFGLLRARALAILRGITEGTEHPAGTQEVEDITTRMATLDEPRVFNGPNGIEVQTDRNFEDVCLVLSEQLHINPKTCTVFEYYNAYEFMQRRAKEAEKARKSGLNRR